MNEGLAKVREFLDGCGAAGVLVESQPNFHWLTGGRGFIGLNSETACASLLVTKDSAYALTNNIEGKRLLAEELPDGFTLLEYPWHDEKNRNYLLTEHCPGVVVKDCEHAARFMAMRTVLTGDQIATYRRIGPVVASILETSLLALKPGMTELELAGVMSAALWKENIEPVTLLVGFDDRLTRWRHLLPTGAVFDRIAMASLAVRHKGLFVSATRQVCRGDVPDELAEKNRAVNAVNAEMILSTVPGRTMSEMLDVAKNAYAKRGFPNEWRHHHQGGLTGYASRESKAYPGNTVTAQCNQAFAWNPTISGTKSEETVLLFADNHEIVTHTGEWRYENHNGLNMAGIISLY